MPRTEWGWEIAPEELRSWILLEDDDVLAVNKPAHVVCHPSKHGPASSLVGAARLHTGLARLHMPSRLDRETSGVVVFAKKAATGSALQGAIQRGAAKKRYTAILHGRLERETRVDAPLDRAPNALFRLRMGVVEGGAASVTTFVPLDYRRGFTLAEAKPESGRLHQIRVHAAHICHPVAGDKLYGPDETLFIEFIEQGWTPRLAAALPLDRQALHASSLTIETPERTFSFEAPLAQDLRLFWESLRV
ncbi:MAG: RluA family pseudouridine synthase [Bryobacteraceae bacterium]|nr:RluA family pseudouridine synthase [Bryobacteraceae bacterium]